MTRTNELSNIIQAIRLASLNSLKEAQVEVKDLVILANAVTELETIIESKETQEAHRLQRERDIRRQFDKEAKAFKVTEIYKLNDLKRG